MRVMSVRQSSKVNMDDVCTYLNRTVIRPAIELICPLLSGMFNTDKRAIKEQDVSALQVGAQQEPECATPRFFTKPHTHIPICECCWWCISLLWAQIPVDSLKQWQQLSNWVELVLNLVNFKGSSSIMPFLKSNTSSFMPLATLLAGLNQSLCKQHISEIFKFTYKCCTLW